MTRRIRIVLAVAAAAALVLASAMPLVAATSRPVIALTPATAVPGGRVDITGEGFVPYEGIDLFFDGAHRDVVTADADGLFDARVTIGFPGGARPALDLGSWTTRCRGDPDAGGRAFGAADRLAAAGLRRGSDRSGTRGPLDHGDDPSCAHRALASSTVEPAADRRG